jgi:3-hydroxyacyl-[acyl-carrier-protein] dehydratase
MRWYWIDRVTHLEKAKTARAVKCVTLAEEHLHDHFPNYPLMPQSLMIEGMAQTGGILAGSAVDFKENIILAKISKASFHKPVRPGDKMVFDAELVESRPEGHRAQIRVTVDGELVAESNMMFVNLNSPEGTRDIFVFPKSFMQLLRESQCLQEDVSLSGGPGG